MVLWARVRRPIHPGGATFKEASQLARIPEALVTHQMRCGLNIGYDPGAIGGVSRGPSGMRPSPVLPLPESEPVALGEALKGMVEQS